MTLQKIQHSPKKLPQLVAQALIDALESGQIQVGQELPSERDLAEMLGVGRGSLRECLAILATHTGNTSVFSFAAEVEYHARFLTPLAKIKIPFYGRSIYDSAIRADMTICDTELEGPAPFYKDDAKIVKRQYALHQTHRF